VTTREQILRESPEARTRRLAALRVYHAKRSSGLTRSQAAKKRFENPAERARMSEMTRRRWAENPEKMKSLTKNSWAKLSTEQKEKALVILRANKAPPRTKAFMAQISVLSVTPEALTRRSLAKKEDWKENREARILASRQAWQDPQKRARMLSGLVFVKPGQKPLMVYTRTSRSEATTKRHFREQLPGFDDMELFKTLMENRRLIQQLAPKRKKGVRHERHQTRSTTRNGNRNINSR